MARPFFSVVVNNHNYGRFLRQAVDSALGQDFPPGEFEVIVVDDGSTDDSRAVLASYGERVRAVLQPRQGQAAACNRGLAEARGEVACLLDSDDVWYPGKLAAAAGPFDDPAVGAVEHWLEDTDADLKPIPQNFPSWPGRYRLEDFLDGRTEFTATSGLCLRRRFLERVLPIPLELFYYLDDFLIAGTLFESEAANIPRVLGAHRVHGGNWCAQGLADARKIETDLRMREIFAERVKLWLDDSGRSLTPRFASLQELEVFRRRVLAEALRARPEKAWQAWKAGAGHFLGTAFGRFRAATVLLAAISPDLYLSLYALYARSSSLKSLRRTGFPET